MAMKRQDYVNRLMKISELNSQYNSLKDIPLFCVRPTTYLQNVQISENDQKRHQIFYDMNPTNKQKTEYSSFFSTSSSQKLSPHKKRRVTT